MKANQTNLLYVDSDNDRLLAFQQLISHEHTVHLANTDDDALHTLATTGIHVVIAHQRPAEGSAIDFLQRVRAEFPHTYRVIVNSPGEVDASTAPIDPELVYHRLTSPLTAGDLNHCVKRILELIQLSDKNKQLTHDLNRAHQQLLHKTKELEREIESGIKNQQRFCGLLETAPDAMVITDEAGKVVLVNQQTEAIFGYLRQQLVDQSIEKLIPKQQGFENADQLENIFSSLQRTKHKISMELLGQRKDKQQFPIEVSISPLVTIDGVLISISIRDITKRKDSERQICTLNEDLEQRVKIRTEELVAAKNIADQANQTKSMFLANMSHEIRTPMNGVIGLIDVLQRSKLSIDQQHLLSTMRDSGISLLKIIDDILDFSKIEAGKMETEQVPISVSDIVENVATILACNAAQNKLLFRVFIDPLIPEWLISDPLKLRQIILNLGSNAIKFTQNINNKMGQIYIQVNVQDKQADKVNLQFVIKDNGIGMSSTTVASLFKPFTQAENSTTRRFGGTGLGLSISARLTRLLGGTIAVQSKENEGSTFTALIPFTIKHPTTLGYPGNTHQIKKNAEQAAIAWQLKKQRIVLLIHDEENRHIITQYLNQRMLELRIVHHADKLITTEQTCDVIIVDHVNDLELLVAQNGTLADELPCHVVLLKHRSGIDADLAHIHYSVVQSNPIYPSVLLKTITQSPGHIKNQGTPETLDNDMSPGTASLDADSSNPDASIPESSNLDSPDTTPLDNTSPGETASDNASRDKIPGAAKPNQTTAPSVSEAEANGNLILLVEDNKINQDIIVRQLNLLGYAAEVSSDGLQALERLQQKQYALLLTDCHMPNMDGFQLTDAIRSEEQHSGRHIPILAITANAMTGYAERCIDAGMDDYISKPVRLQELTNLLNKWLPLSEDAPEHEPETDQPRNAGKEQPDTATADSTISDALNPIDPDALFKLVGDNQQTHHSLLKKFLVSAESTIGEFHVAYDDHSVDAIKQLAHRLKSAARAVGANKLADLCISLEQAGSSDAWEDLNTLRPQLDETMLSVKTYIERL